MLSSLAVLAASAVTMVAADSVTTGNASSYYATSAPIQTYQSVDFTAPEFNVLTYDETKASPNLTMLSYRGTATSPSPLVMDNNGEFLFMLLPFIFTHFAAPSVGASPSPSFTPTSAIAVPSKEPVADPYPFSHRFPRLVR